VYGVPGFETSDDVEELAFDSLDEHEAISIARIGFGVEASSAERLDTERDDSFRVATTLGDRVLKVAHPADNTSVIGLQLRALQFAARADPSLPLQRIVRTSFGGPLHILPNGRVAWMFEWMPGTLLLDAPASAHDLDALGTALGRLSKSLRKFEAADALRLSAWDLQTVPRLATLLDIFPNDAVAGALARFRAHVDPQLGELPMQVIHNDFNPGNVLVDPGGDEFVVGILDFGDVVYSLRVADLAIALCYQISPLHHAYRDLGAMIDAFDRQVRLTEAEHAVLPDLVAARFAQRILINQWLDRHDPGHDGLHDANASALSELLDLEA
jgi:Ser/Thr protein kinase RdoA (MazF antagonist)